MNKEERLKSPQMVQKTSAKRYPEGEARFAYPAEPAPSDKTIIRCYLDDDITPSAWVVDTAYDTEGYVIGDEDGKTYHCCNPHTSAAANRPTTGANWADYWELAEVDVYCIVHAATALAECTPFLLDDGTTPIQVVQIEGEYWCVSDIFIGYYDCAPEE